MGVALSSIEGSEACHRSGLVQSSRSAGVTVSQSRCFVQNQFLCLNVHRPDSSSAFFHAFKFISPTCKIRKNPLENTKSLAG